MSLYLHHLVFYCDMLFKVQNRTSYQCPGCQSTFSDLDVDRIIDHVDGSLKLVFIFVFCHNDTCMLFIQMFTL